MKCQMCRKISTDTSLEKGGMPLSPRNSGKEGERANGQRPRQRKMGSKKKKEKKRRAYGVGRTLLSMLGKRNLWRVLAVGKDCLCMFEF